MQKKLKILQTNTIFETFNSFTKGQLKYLKDNGLDVIATCSPDSRAQVFFDTEGVRFKLINIERDISFLKDLKSFFIVLIFLIKERPDIIQASTPKSAFIFLIASYILRVKTRIFFMRGVRSSTLKGSKRIIVKLMERITCYCAHQVICTSKSVRKEIIESNICRADKSKVLLGGTGNGVNSDFYSPVDKNTALLNSLKIPKESIVVMFSGRLVRDKGVFELYEAWKLIKNECPNAYLIMAGQNEFDDSISPSLYNSLKEDYSVRLTGYTDDIKSLYSISDVFVLPSYREGLPISILEASSMGLPVVTTNATGCIDAVINNVTGYIVELKNIEQLKNALIMYIADAKLRRDHGLSGRNMVIENFSPQKIWAALLAEYQSSSNDERHD